MRVLRDRKPKVEVNSQTPSPVTGTQSTKANMQKPPVLCRKPEVRSQEIPVISVLSSESEDNMLSNEDLPPLEMFGLSELAMSSFQSVNEIYSSTTASTSAPVKKRIRNPPKEPVICSVCNQRFTRKAHLVRHMFLHTGEKPFKCNYCDQSFNRRDHLRAHLQNHTEVKDHKCSQCNATFKVLEHLRVHIRKSHGSQNSTPKHDFSSSAVTSTSDQSSGQSDNGEQSSKPTFGFKIMTCPHCDKKFTQTHLFNAHVTSHKKNGGASSSIVFPKNLDVQKALNVKVSIKSNEQQMAELHDNANLSAGSSDLEQEDNGEQSVDENDEDATDSHLEQDEDSENTDKPKKYECVVCAKIFKDQGTLRRHYKIHKRNFICRFCGIKMASAGSLMRHNLLHTGVKPFKCKLCSRKFSRKDALKAHLIAHEKDSSKLKLPRPYSCRICTASYTMRYNLIRHMRQNHQTGVNKAHVADPGRNSPVHEEEFEEEPSKSLQCKHCGKQFASMKSLNTHAWYHNQEKRYICKLCNHGFKYATDLNRHYLAHRRGKRIPINITKVRAQNSLAHARLQQKGPKKRAPPVHNSVVIDGVRQYPCSVCGQVFNHRSNRSRHMRLLHTVNKHNAPPPNSLVPKLVKQTNAMRAEMAGKHRKLISTPTLIKKGTASAPSTQVQLSPKSEYGTTTVIWDNDEPLPNYHGMYKCDQCGKIFDKRYSFKLHLRTHNKQYACEVCGLRTASQGDLTLHIRTHTGEKPFQCSQCDWRFCRRSALTVHVRRHHGPNAKVKRHYNPERVTPNIINSAEIAPNDTFSEDNDDDQDEEIDTSILKTMLEKYPYQTDGSRKAMPQLQQHTSQQEPPQRAEQRKKNLPPPPPLIRYPIPLASTNLIKSEPTLKKESNSEQFVYICNACGTLISGKQKYVEHMLSHGAAVSLNNPQSNQIKFHQQPKGNQGKVLKAGPPTLQIRPSSAAQVISVQNPGKSLTIQPAIGAMCRQCGQSFKSKHELTVHALVSHSQSGIAVPCGICRKLCSTMGFLSRHYQYVHPEAPNAAEEARVTLLQNRAKTVQHEREDVQDYADNLLIPEVVIQEGYEDSQLNEEDDDFEDLSFVPEKYLQHHESSTVRKIQHPPETNQQMAVNTVLYKCPLCTKVFKDKKALADHKWYHGREAVYPCTMCERRFKLKTDLVRHYQRHLQERPYLCSEDPKCNARFRDNAELEMHVASSHKSQALSDEDLYENEEGQDDKNYSYELEQLEIDVDHEEEEETIQDDNEDNGDQDGSTHEDEHTEFVDNGPPYTCEICGKVTLTFQKFMHHRYYHKRESRFSCPHCDEKFKIKSHMDRHVNTYHNTKKPAKNVLHCPAEGCARKFTRDYDLSNHIQNVHNRGEAVEEEYDDENIQEDTNMDDGNNGSHDEAGYEDVDTAEWEIDESLDDSQAESILQPCMNKLEEYTNDNGDLFCKPCNKQFKDLKTLQSHLYYHQREYKHSCDSCGAKFKQNSDLRRHIRIHHDPNKKRVCIPCPKCNRSFSDERYLRVHLNRCDGITESSVPSTSSVNKVDKSESIKSIVSENNEEEDDDSEALVIDFDDKEVDNPANVDQEMWEEEPNPLMFVSSNLQVNEIEDDGMYDDDRDQRQVVTTFECNVCGMGFLRSNELILHKRSHQNQATNGSTTAPITTVRIPPRRGNGGGGSTSSKKKNQKPIVCDKCGKSFIQRAELTQHLQRYHINELPVYECQFCPKFFYVKKSLDTHRRRHHSHLLPNTK